MVTLIPYKGITPHNLNYTRSHCAMVEVTLESSLKKFRWVLLYPFLNSHFHLTCVIKSSSSNTALHCKINQIEVSECQMKAVCWITNHWQAQFSDSLIFGQIWWGYTLSWWMQIIFRFLFAFFSITSEWANWFVQTDKLHSMRLFLNWLWSKCITEDGERLWVLQNMSVPQQLTPDFLKNRRIEICSNLQKFSICCS